tara:strand:+ start:392 stop:1003 length:612 start_codon:yes stop_codon:yes gene_type:complete
MAKIRLTKNELKKQKDALKRFQRYLPMLILKKKQLQMEIFKLQRAIKEVAQKAGNLRNAIISWVDLFAEKTSIDEYLKLKEVKTTEGNVAGIDLPIFESVEFDQKDYDLMLTPLWVDRAIEDLKQTMAFKAESIILHKQSAILKEELRIATQRVNLFEKIKIPEAKENIRTIQIYLGEVQTAEVVRGKIAKAKLERKKVIAGV